MFRGRSSSSSVSPALAFVGAVDGGRPVFSPPDKVLIAFRARSDGGFFGDFMAFHLSATRVAGKPYPCRDTCQL